MTTQYIYRTPKGNQWCCSNPQCLEERDQWETDNTELVHCATENCHGVVWTEKGLRCNECGQWYCMFCWQNTGKFDPNDDDEWYCSECNADIDENES